jgi:transcriptional regulator with XRE-family HTH domain
MTSKELPLNNEVLRWARDQTDFSLKDVADRAGIAPLKGHRNTPAVTAAQRLASWENGKSIPTIHQLSAIDKVCRLPLTTFFFKDFQVNINIMLTFG